MGLAGGSRGGGGLQLLAEMWQLLVGCHIATCHTTLGRQYGLVLLQCGILPRGLMHCDAGGTFLPVNQRVLYVNAFCSIEGLMNFERQLRLGGGSCVACWTAADVS